jgi:hypothetical protein
MSFIAPHQDPTCRFWSKPFLPDALIAVVHQLLARLA